MYELEGWQDLWVKPESKVTGSKTSFDKYKYWEFHLKYWIQQIAYQKNEEKP